MNNARYDVTHGKGIKTLTPKVYRNITNSIKFEYKIDTIFMNSENSETSDPQTIIQAFGQKNVNKIDIYVVSSNLSIYCTRRKIKNTCKNNKFKMSAPIWNDRFELPDASYFVSDK